MNVLVLSLCIQISLGKTVVYPRLLEPREDGGQFTLHVRDDLTLNLKKSSIFSPHIYLTEHVEGKVINSLVNGTELERNLYHDSEHASSLLVERRGRDVHVRGILTRDLRIEPLLAEKRSRHGDIAHRVYQVQMKLPDDYTVSSASRILKKRNLDETSSGVIEDILMEVFVLMDPSYSSHFSTWFSAVPYVAMFFNSVNNRFAEVSISGAKIELRVVGFEKSGPQPPYEKVNDDKIDGPLTFPLLDRYIAGTSTVNSADVVVLMTAYDLHLPDKNNRPNFAVQGVARVGKACTKEKAAIVEDSPTLYTGVEAAAHEIAHLFGALHDGEGSAASCPARSGHIMTPENGDIRLLSFSTCSQTAMEAFFSGVDDRCLDVLSRNIMFARMTELPGTKVDGVALCKLKYPRFNNITVATRPHDSIKCVIRCQMKKRRNIIYASLRAPDGTPCVDEGESEKICINGLCVPKPT
uniref:Putative secreted metalloprotease n=1 Tax=Ixodes ricinus TaxID=34613 RepID=A0A6B0VBQ5_IXORI